MTAAHGVTHFRYQVIAMKARLVLLSWVGALGVLGLNAAHAAEWAKFTSVAGNFSLHYPAGWKAVETDGALEVSHHASGEQLTLLALPLDLGKTARAIAETMVDRIRRDQIPSLTVKQWRPGEHPDTAVTLLTAYTQEGREFLADAVVTRDQGAALWVSYSVPQVDYSPARSQALLVGVLGSMAGGDASQPPTGALPGLPSAQVERNGRAFVFVLEFGLGAPFSTAQENVILDAFKAAALALTADERRKFDDYPGLQAVLLKLGQDQFEQVRHEVRVTLREALQVSGDDPTLKLIEQELNRSAEVVAKGPPPLLRVAAQAMGEMLAYGRLLQRDPQAGPAEIDADRAGEQREQVVKLWPRMPDETRKLVASAPGLWLVCRTVLETGTAEQQASLRQQLRQLSVVDPKTATTTEASPADSDAGRELTRRFIQHNTLMMMQQQTFNTYMWSRGYQGWTPMGKMW